MRVSGVTTLDEALINARAGDEAGFLALWDALQPRLLRYLQVIGCDDVDDVAGETWLQVVRDLAKFKKDNADEFRAWVFTIARHRAIDAARSRPPVPQRDMAAGRRDRRLVPRLPHGPERGSGLFPARQLVGLAGRGQRGDEAIEAVIWTFTH